MKRGFRSLGALLAGALWAVTPFAALPATAAHGDVFIIVANKTYGNGVPNVEFADHDAEKMEAAVQHPRVLNVPVIGRKRFNDMTRGEASDWFRPTGEPGLALKEHVMRATAGRPSATLYFYYTGHGISTDNPIRNRAELHLLLRDTNPKNIGETALSIEAVKLALEATRKQFAPKGRVVMLVDACFSGVGRGGEPLWKDARNAVKMSAVPRPTANPSKSMVVLAAAAENEIAWSDAARKHGAFTDALLDGLYGKAAGPDGKVTAEQLHRYAMQRTNERLARRGLSQTPSIDGDGSITVASLATPFEPREPGRAERLARRCSVMEIERDPAELRRFLDSDCNESDCPCRDKLVKREADIRRLGTLCKEEREDLARLLQKGADAREQIERLGKAALCPQVKQETKDALDRIAASDKQAAEKREIAERARRAEDMRRVEREQAETQKLTELRQQQEAAAARLKQLREAERNAEQADRERRLREATVAPPVFYVMELRYQNKWVEDRRGGLIAQYRGGNIRSCEQQCLAHSNCAMSEFYFGKEDGGKKCSLYAHTIVESSRGEAHVSVKVQR